MYYGHTTLIHFWHRVKNIQKQWMRIRNTLIWRPYYAWHTLLVTIIFVQF